MRADKFFAEKFGSRTKAADYLKRGLVRLNGKVISPDEEAIEGAEYVFLPAEESFVSNGGYKLSRALDHFGCSVAGLVFADLGASTGGFSDCLLKRGAKHIFCVDVGESQLSMSLAHDERITVMDNTNARYLSKDDFPISLDGVVGDLSFISLRLILPVVKEILPSHGIAFLLFKPQYECGMHRLGKSGICPFGLHRELLDEFYDFAGSVGFTVRGIINAPIKKKKNIEYILFLSREGKSLPKWEFLNRVEELRGIKESR